MKNLYLILSVLVGLVFSYTKTTYAGVDGSVIIDTENYKVWWALSGDRITKDAVPFINGFSKEIRVHLAKNETESFLLVVSPKKNIRTSIEDIAEREGVVISCRTVGFVDIPSSIAVPDILHEEKTQELKKGRNGFYWITVKTRAITKSGEFKRHLVINGDKINLSIHVFDFALPSMSSLKTVGRIWWKKDMKTKVELEQIYRTLADHKIHNGGYVIPGPIVTLNLDKRTIRIDFNAFDKMAAYLINDLQVDGFFVPFFFGNWNGLINERWLGKIPILSKEFEYYFGDYCRQLCAHLKEKGWLEKAYIQPWDEPQEKDLNKVVKIAEIIKKAAPSLKIYIASPIRKELCGLVNSWSVPLLKQYFKSDEIKNRQLVGEKIWGYQNYHFNYLSQPLNMRLLPWLAKKYNCTGIEWWAVNYWEEYFGNNNEFKPGNGILMYPTTNNNKKPLSSIRLELYKDGLEDVEYFELLERKIGVYRTMQIINQAILGIDPDERIVDSSLVEKLRVETGEAIERLYKNL